MKKLTLIASFILLSTCGFSQTKQPNMIEVISGKSWNAGEYEVYQKLSSRNKFIVDSLNEAGLISPTSNYLQYQPIYMKELKKIVRSYGIIDSKIVMYTYLLEQHKGFKLLTQKIIK